jgi:hypothetical protein
MNEEGVLIVIVIMVVLLGGRGDMALLAKQFQSI